MGRCLVKSFGVEHGLGGWAGLDCRRRSAKRSRRRHCSRFRQRRGTGRCRSGEPVATGREAHDSTEGPPSHLGRDSESTLHIHVGDTILGGEYGKSNWTVDTGDKLVVQV